MRFPPLEYDNLYETFLLLLLYQNSYQESKYKTRTIQQTLSVFLPSDHLISFPKNQPGFWLVQLLGCTCTKMSKITTGAFSTTLSPHYLVALVHVAFPTDIPRQQASCWGPKELPRIPFQDITLQLSIATTIQVQTHRTDTRCDTQARKGLQACRIFRLGEGNPWGS